jgi:hypothetical protein
MRGAAGGICILASYAILLRAGALIGGLAGEPPPDALLTTPGLLGGILFGLLGGGLLTAGIRFAWDGTDSRPPPSATAVLAAGLCFPGASQAYAGRWLWAAFFLSLPWLLSWLILFAALLHGVMARKFGLDWGLTPSLTTGIVWFRPGPFAYAVLWIASLAEGYRWATRPEGNPPSLHLPRWRGPAVGLGVIAIGVFPLLAGFSFTVKTILQRAGEFNPAAEGKDASSPPLVSELTRRFYVAPVDMAPLVCRVSIDGLDGVWWEAPFGTQAPCASLRVFDSASATQQADIGGGTLLVSGLCLGWWQRVQRGPFYPVPPDTATRESAGARTFSVETRDGDVITFRWDAGLKRLETSAEVPGGLEVVHYRNEGGLLLPDRIDGPAGSFGELQYSMHNGYSLPERAVFTSKPTGTRTTLRVNGCRKEP